jgi:periplasmic copper chaperone A
MALIFAAIAWLAPLAASAHGYRLGAIEIGHLWAAPSRDGVTAVYGPMLNTGGAPDRLIGVSAPNAKSVAIRKTQDGKTVSLDSLALPPGKPVTLAGWGAHVAVVGLAHQMRRGDSFDLTLRFAKAGTITVKVLIQPSAAEP